MTVRTAFAAGVLTLASVAQVQMPPPKPAALPAVGAPKSAAQPAMPPPQR